MRSARHRSKIDSRSDLTYMRNMGVNVLIMGAQKPSALPARLKQLEPELAVSFSSAPVLLQQDVIIRDLTQSALPTTGSAALKTGQHNFSENYTHGRCCISSYKCIQRDYSPQHCKEQKIRSTFLKLWDNNSILAAAQWKKILFAFWLDLQISPLESLPLDFDLILFEIRFYKSKIASAELALHSRGDTQSDTGPQRRFSFTSLNNNLHLLTSLIMSVEERVHRAFNPTYCTETEKHETNKINNSPQCSSRGPGS